VFVGRIVLDPKVGALVVENRDRLLRFGAGYVEAIFLLRAGTDGVPPAIKLKKALHAIDALIRNASRSLVGGASPMFTVGE
jgi:hypothetical protein